MTTKQDLFGTDGIRGVANKSPMTPENAFRLGRAAGYFFKKKEQAQHPLFIIGKDSRLSGSMLESALAAGLNSIGANALLAGIVPTPAVALLTQLHKANAGIVISASHNQAEDNGLKLFRGDGYKLDDREEKRLEELILTSEIDTIRPIGADLGTTTLLSGPIEAYVNTVLETVPRLSLHGLRIAVDCANGASYQSTPQILKNLGAEVLLFHASPNGLNINHHCGSTHGEEIRRLTLESQADLGIAHDGDADRLLLCDEKGALLDGDEILAITALDALAKKALPHKTIVATIMSNFGLEACLKKAGGKVVRTGVGDRQVLETMIHNGFIIGGEQSGHLIFLNHSTTGDGIVAALQVLQIMHQTKQPLSQLRNCLIKYPQVQRNLRVKNKTPIESLDKVSSLVKKIEEELQEKGRIVIRYSGTEPLIRILLEGPDINYLEKQADELVNEIDQCIGEK